jgi:hypothetical protein
VPRRRRVGGTRPEARRDEKQEFSHSGNRQFGRPRPLQGVDR